MNEIKVILCPSCGRENHINDELMIDDVTCEFCHAELNSNPELNNQIIDSPPSVPKYLNPKKMPYSSARPFWYVALMMMMTLGLYRIVWLYRSWQILSQHYKLKNNIAFNILYDPIFCFRFFKYAFLLGKECGYKPLMPNIIYPMLYSILLILFAVCLKIMGEEMDVYGISAVVLLALWLIPVHGAVQAINAGYNLVEPGTRIRTTLTPWSIVFVCIGSFLWYGIILSIFELS